MTTIYLINNSLTMNNLNFPIKETLEQKREKRILSIEGENASLKLAHSPILQNVTVIYSSPFVMSLGTAKYLSQALEKEIHIDSLIGERKIGALGDKKISMIAEFQENDFTYKLPGGESLNDVNIRMKRFMSNLLEEHPDKEIAVFTHNVAITSYLSSYCEKGFNLDNRLILNFSDDAIIDGTWDGITIIKLVFQEKEILSITRER